MKFAHLVEINDPHNPLIQKLSRTQLWRGLVRRAETPTAFVPYLDSCRILEKSAQALSRELHYGSLVVRDHVTLVPERQVIYQVPEQEGIPPSSLVMTIEEPEAGIYFVRFEYDDGASEAADAADAFYNDFRKSAYTESDIDTIRTIRELAELGQLD
ncbi:MAG TPA: SRPBCC family protein [Noviherbaspirillum sp.]|uniref:SRPBCC family protein n=1 Tax=Noviherbaspirillum sp. TaxID=1926288 RepID=UPI002F93377E